jgi:polyisoprenoid-binding protein YceI
MKPVIRNVLAGAVVLAVGAMAGPWIYINVVKQDAPQVLTLEPAVTTTIEEQTVETVAEVSPIDGQWVVAAESVVGYRAKEVIIGQKTEGVGRTSAVTGVLTIADEQVTGAEFTVDMTTLKSDSSRRDRQVNTRNWVFP